MAARPARAGRRRCSRRPPAPTATRAWVRPRDELVDEGWFGPRVSADALARLGDVALVARGTAAFSEPTDTGPY